METATSNAEPEKKAKFRASEIEYASYGGEHHLPLIMSLVDHELSEPYSFLAFHRGKCVGTVVCKMGEHRSTYRGYIAMPVVIKPYRGKGIGSCPNLGTLVALIGVRCDPLSHVKAWSIVVSHLTASD